MSKLEVLEWALVGVEERLGYFLKVSERNELNGKRDYLMDQITIQKVIESRKTLEQWELEEIRNELIRLEECESGADKKGESK